MRREREKRRRAREKRRREREEKRKGGEERRGESEVPGEGGRIYSLISVGITDGN